MNGGDPTVVDRMSMYEILSVFASAQRLRRSADSKTGPSVTDEDWKNAEDLLSSVTHNDPSVRIH